MGPRAFSVTSDKILSVLTTACGVCKAFDPSRTMQRPTITSFSALWDTGATNSVIDKSIVEKLGLTPVGVGKVFHANGEAVVNKYLVNIVLPNNFMIPMVTVTEGKLQGTNMLIGMDIIGLGDFVITHKNNGTIFSFQMPSTHDLDFAAELNQKQ